VWLDADHTYPLAWDAWDREGKLVRRFRLRSICRNDSGEWQARRMEINLPGERRIVRIEFAGR
jgi:negative regulator of sigma E activity